MPFEVTCGQCHGALLVEQAGVVVECPSCGAHLAIPADAGADHEVEAELTEAETSASAEPATVPPAPPTESHVVEERPPSPPEPFVSHSSPYLNQLASLSASLSTISDAETNDKPSDVEVAAAVPVTEIPPVAAPVPAPVEAAAEPQPAAEITEPPLVVAEVPPLPEAPFAVGAAIPSATTVEPPSPVLMHEPPSPIGTAPVADTIQVDIPPPPPREVVSKQLFFYVATYASALTLVVIYLVYAMLTHREHALESLPDIEPPMQQGKIGMKTAKPSDEVPRGHVLRLGETERFGNVRVTPLRITRGPVTFEHLFGDRNMVRDPSKPVYKLWLRFENASKDQEFIPLSTPLVYKRHSVGLGKYKTNNFLASETERAKKNGDIYYLFDLPESSEFALVGQKLNQPLPPGGTWETFLAAEDSLDTIEGEWTWRVFFRKGYNPQSHRGVTTVIDVRFDGSTIVADSDAAHAS